MITTLQATDETDAKLKEHYFWQGYYDALGGERRFPHDIQDPHSLIAKWWREGYDSFKGGTV